jgi:DNA-binding GntR family transcriptional regulator
MTKAGGTPQGAMDMYRRISDDIQHGRLSAADRLSENALSERYGMSRTPIREALTRLEQDGLIVRQGAMARLRVRTTDEISDIYRARTCIERAIAEDAANRHGEIDLMRLQAAWEREDALNPEAAAPIDLMIANRAFHDALATASHNAALVDLQGRLTLQVAQMPATTLSVPGRWVQAHEQHRLLIGHIRARDAKAAGSLAELHIAQARDIRLSLSDEL